MVLKLEWLTQSIIFEFYVEKPSFARFRMKFNFKWFPPKRKEWIHIDDTGPKHDHLQYKSKLKFILTEKIRRKSFFLFCHKNKSNQVRVFRICWINQIQNYGKYQCFGKKFLSSKNQYAWLMQHVLVKNIVSLTMMHKMVSSTFRPQECKKKPLMHLP